MGERRKGREAALRLLYQIDASGDRSVDARERFWRSHASGEPNREFADRLTDAVLEQCETLDGVIEAALDNWQLDRLARIDLLLLRLSVCELLQDDASPVAVVIDEAIEISRKYSDPESPAFINGVLDRVARDRGLVKN